MAEKLEGEFLHIEQDKDGYFKVEYADESGSPRWVRLSTDYMVERATGARGDIEKHLQQLSQFTGTPKERQKLEARLRYARFEAVWPEMYVAYRRGESLSQFFEGVQNVQEPFGIPVTKGRLLSKGKNGVVVSYNLRHLLLQRIYRAQLFSANKTPLTSVISPHVRVTDIFDCPNLENPVPFVFAQKEFSAVVFIKTPQFEFSENTRIVFWFARHAREATKDDDILDLPEEMIPLLTALIEKQILERTGKPVMPGIEETIKRETKRIEQEGNIQNYYFSDTTNISAEEIEEVSWTDRTDIQEKAEPKEWNGTKSEFCLEIRREYEQNPKMYKHLKDAAFKMFAKYKFTDWTAQKCYDLLKRTK